ncbi:MAG: DUF4271 domain-containing protein [Dysgonamonadaceae bacterium]|jgi:hypothetical protein|nr:DUF4271 domain-containing protein [Dysgonamonadaceae bacterium]
MPIHVHLPPYNKMQENELTYQSDPLATNRDSLTTQQDSCLVEVISNDFLYCFPDYFPEQKNDTIASTSSTFTPKIEKIPDNPKLFDSVFIVFLVCFIIISRVLGSKARMFLSLPEELFRLKERKSIFSEPVGNELYIKLLLIFQTIIILSIFSYTVFIGNKENEIVVLSGFYENLGKIGLLLASFFIYKWISYNIIGSIFFQKEILTQWLNNFTSMICLLGVIIFIPVVLMFYVKWMFSFCYFFVLFCILTIIIIVICRTYVLFFYNLRKLHYLFLYLCGQEMAPLLVLHLGLVYLS